MKHELTIFPDFIYLSIVFIILLLAEGYEFGRGDAAETLAYSAWIRDPALFQRDFYIQSIVHEVPNERWLFSLGLSGLGDRPEWMVFLLFVLCTGGMLVGLYRMARLIMGHQYRYAPWIAVLFALVPFQGINPGDNELYISSFLPGSLALCLCTWAWYRWMRDAYPGACYLLLIATLIHPMIGFQSFLLITGSSLLIHRNLTKMYLSLGIYLLVTIPWLAMILIRYEEGTNQGNHFMEIIRFRLSHHFLPDTFRITAWALSAAWTSVSIVLMRGEVGTTLDSPVGKILVASVMMIGGMLVYTFGVTCLGSEYFISTQWFATAIWLKTFSLLYIASYFLRRQMPAANWDVERLSRWGIPLAAIGLMTGVYTGSGPLRDREYQFPWQAQHPESAMATVCNQQTESNALFLLPPDCTAFPYYSHRSNYISFKQMVHKKRVIEAWYERVEEVYGPLNREEKADMDLMRRNWLKKPPDWWLTMKREKGITHVFTYGDHVLPFEQIASNGAFAVYRL